MVEEISNKDLTLPGSIASISAALQATQQSRENSLNEMKILPETYLTAQSYSSMQGDEGSN
jgi:hypothetical protein